MSFWMILTLFAAMQTSIESADLRCHGGAQIFFEVGSETINSYGVHRLEMFVSYWNERNHPGFVRIESGGDGIGSSFDRNLSLRRSEAIRDFLAARGHVARETVIVIGETLNHPDGAEDSIFLQMGWVAQRIPREEYERLYPSNLVAECF